MQRGDTHQFRELCSAHGISVTHQRYVLFEALESMPGHPSPEEVYARVKQRIPSISLATVYKNIHLFIESGIFREVSLHHGTLRLEMNRRPHHHLVCTVCKSIMDVDAEELGLSTEVRTLPGGFVAERFSVDILGRCAACQQATPEAPSNSAT